MALRQAEPRSPVIDPIRQIRISEQTYYRWKETYLGLEPDQFRELKQVIENNVRLKKLVAKFSRGEAVLYEAV